MRRWQEREKVFAKGKKKSLRFSRVVPAHGPAGWAGGRAGGQVGGGWGGTEAALQWPCRPPYPLHTPQPSFQLWTTHPEPCAPTEVRGGQEGRPPGSSGGGG